MLEEEHREICDKTPLKMWTSEDVRAFLDEMKREQAVKIPQYPRGE